ncbi:MAG: alpha-amylase [Bifidobacteriaceae bacterium]|jgi:glycosidase|nr:alpha-amylase [Bifidobacteriaceae bacterium]
MSVAWAVYPLGFAGGEGLARVASWLDYAAELGVSALALGPVFASTSHGYDTVDHFAIDPRLGTEADFDALVLAAHERGLKVYLDGVFNHVGEQHPLFRQAIEDPPSGAGSFFRWTDGHPYLFEGSPGLVTLDHEAPGVVSLVTDTMLHWLGRGADGWRLDAAYAVPRGFWRSVLPTVRLEYPGAFIWGEVLHGDYAGFVRETGVDSVTQYELWKAIWSALKDANFWELSWALKRHGAMVESFAPVTFVSNHDVTRIATQVGPTGAALAAIVLLTVGGSPHIYYGDEQAFVGLKEERPGGDDAVRPAFPGSRSELWDGGWWLFELYRRLVALRRARPWLERALTTDIELDNTRYVYRTEGSGGAGEGEALVVELDLGDEDRPYAIVSDDDGSELVVFRP